MPRRLSLAAALTGFLALPLAGVAQDTAAGADILVLGSPSQGAERAFADAFNAAAALRKSAGHVVELRRELAPEATLGALDTLAGHDAVLVYFAGPLAPEGGETALVAQEIVDPRLTLNAITARLADAGAGSVIYLLENCATLAGAPQMFDATGLDQAALPVTLFASAETGATCPANGARLTDLLVSAASATQGPQPLAQVLADLPIRVFGPDTAAAYSLGRPAPASAPAGTSGGGGAVQVVDNTDATATGGDLIIVTGPVAAAPVSSVSAVTSSDRAAPLARATGRGGEIAVFNAPPLAQQASLPVGEGLPRPSIILGLIAPPDNASFDTVPDNPGEVSANEVTFDNLDARRALRDTDPELFATLVEGGAFDPPQGQLAVALQTELKRMKCYTARIDGAWGGGSRASVDRYFAQIGDTPVTRDATIELYRQIVMKDDVECPAPVANVQTPRRNTGGSSGGTTTSRPSTPAPPPPPPPPSGGTINPGGLTGVFR